MCTSKTTEEYFRLVLVHGPRGMCFRMFLFSFLLLYWTKILSRHANILSSNFCIFLDFTPNKHKSVLRNQTYFILSPFECFYCFQRINPLYFIHYHKLTLLCSFDRLYLGTMQFNVHTVMKAKTFKTTILQTRRKSFLTLFIKYLGPLSKT